MPLEIAGKFAAPPEDLIASVRRYIDENYRPDEYADACCTAEDFRSAPRPSRGTGEPLLCRSICAPPAGSASPAEEPETLEEYLQELDAGFSETLLRLIDRSGKKDSEIYKKANVDRKLFSKIRSRRDYQPSKHTALAFAFALELSLEETEDFIARAGFALSRSSRFDLICEYFLIHHNYDLTELNQVLYRFDQPLIGA